METENMMKEAELKDLINVSRSREFSLQKAQRIVCCANLFLFDYNMILFWIISVKVYFSFCLTKFNGCFFDSSPKYPTFSRLYFISRFWYWLKKKPGKLQICILIEKSIFVYKSLHVYRYILQKLCSEYQLTVYVCLYLTEALFWVLVDSLCMFVSYRSFVLSISWQSIKSSTSFTSTAEMSTTLWNGWEQAESEMVRKHQ